MGVDRRSILVAGLGLGAASAATAAEKSQSGKARAQHATDANTASLVPNSGIDQTASLQAAIDHAADNGLVVVLPEGHFIVSDLRLRSGTVLIGRSQRTVLEFAGGAAFITADKADGIILRDLVLDGLYKTLDEERGEALLTIANSADIEISSVTIRNGVKTGLSLSDCGGRIAAIDIHDVLDAGIKSLDAKALDIRDCTITRCGNNGLLVWRSAPGEDGTVVASNRISAIRNAAGGTGEYGNGINVFRAGSVLVQANRVHDCAYSAIRGNAASNIQIVANSCERLGEVAIYSEFGFEGALIANNLVDGAATGISVTNFNEGGRLAVIQGNLIRNLFRREHEPEDKRGEGIGVEADASVTGNTIEGATTVGIQIGWGPYMRNVAATGNVIRQAGVGITITNAVEAGACLIANNLICDTRNGAIRHMSQGTPLGPDLARQAQQAGRITLSGNVAA